MASSLRRLSFDGTYKPTLNIIFQYSKTAQPIYHTKNITCWRENIILPVGTYSVSFNFQFHNNWERIRVFPLKIQTLDLHTLHSNTLQIFNFIGNT